MRIAIIGPESCGKSTLSIALSTRLGMPYIEEYARTYIEHLNRPYTYRDVSAIAHKQIKQIGNNTHAIFDTDLIITEVWFSRCYGRSPFWLWKAMEKTPMDGYLLCYPDINWIADPTRENENNREELFRAYLYRVQQTRVPYTIIRGTEQEQRIEQAVRFIQQIKEETFNDLRREE